MNYKLFLKVIVSALFLLVVFVKVDMEVFYKAIFSVDIHYYFLSFALLLGNSIILAWKYKIIMKPSGIYQPFITLLKINFICRFYSIFLTSAMGQGVIRWYISTKNQHGRSKFVAVMVFERSTFLYALFAVVFLVLFFVPGLNLSAIKSSIYSLSTGALLTLSLFYFYLNWPPFYLKFEKLATKFYGKKKIVLDKFIEFIRLFTIFYQRKDTLTVSLILSFIWHMFFLLRVYYMVVSLQVPLNFIQLGWMASLVLFLQVMPVTFNGIGIRETAYAFLFRLEGLPPEQGVLLGLLLFSQMLLMSAIGGVLYFFVND